MSKKTRLGFIMDRIEKDERMPQRVQKVIGDDKESERLRATSVSTAKSGVSGKELTPNAVTNVSYISGRRNVRKLIEEPWLSSFNDRSGVDPDCLDLGNVRLQLTDEKHIGAIKVTADGDKIEDVHGAIQDYLGAINDSTKTYVVGAGHNNRRKRQTLGSGYFNAPAFALSLVGAGDELLEVESKSNMDMIRFASAAIQAYTMSGLSETVYVSQKIREAQGIFEELSKKAMDRNTPLGTFMRKARQRLGDSVEDHNIAHSLRDIDHGLAEPSKEQYILADCLENLEKIDIETARKTRGYDLLVRGDKVEEIVIDAYLAIADICRPNPPVNHGPETAEFTGGNIPLTNRIGPTRFVKGTRKPDYTSATECYLEFLEDAIDKYVMNCFGEAGDKPSIGAEIGLKLIGAGIALEELSIEDPENSRIYLEQAERAYRASGFTDSFYVADRLETIKYDLLHLDGSSELG